MATFEAKILDGPQALRHASPLWDSLWQRSASTAPVMQAEFVAQWLEQFAPNLPCRSVLILKDGEAVAALPLVGQKKGGLVQVGAVPSNPWCLTGDLLLAPDVGADALDLLVATLVGLDWPLLWLEPVPFQRPDWQALLAAAHRANWSTLTHESYSIGQVAIGNDWAAYETTWSGNHRRHMRKAMRRATEIGKLRLRIERDFDLGRLPELLQQAFELEDRGWKGRGGGSVLRTPGMFDLACRQGAALAFNHQLALTYLEHNGHTIAFEYGFFGKGIYFSPKVAYDESVSELSPGQLLRLELLRHFHDSREATTVDFWGPLSEATSRWTTNAYPMGRVLMTHKRLGGRLLMNAYKHARPWVRRLRRIER